MQKIQLNDYSIVLGAVDSILTSYIQSQDYSQYFILVDENTARDCLPLIADIKGLEGAIVVEIESGEINKTIHTCIDVWQRYISAGADRHALCINLGGGVIGDMGGFIASAYKRGIDFLNIPTTLLSQVDATIGGKLGIDFEGVKNSIGFFKNPKQVIVDQTFFKTLPQRQIRSGFAEIIKHALIEDKGYWEELQVIEDISDVNDWQNIVKKSIYIKRDVVEQDPFEKGLRKILNFGHTIGHGVESYSLENDVEPLLHGEAIALGMICEAYMASKINGLSVQDLEQLTVFILKHYGKYNLDISQFDQIVRYMYNDKKNKGNDIQFALINRIGETDFNISGSETLIREALVYYTTL